MEIAKEHSGSLNYRAVVKEAEKLNESLLCTDPRFRRDVLIFDMEGTVLFYRSAFLLRLGEWLLVFTEHHGTHVHHTDELVYYKQFLPQDWVGGDDQLKKVVSLFSTLFSTRNKVIPIQSVRRRKVTPLKSRKASVTSTCALETAPAGVEGGMEAPTTGIAKKGKKVSPTAATKKGKKAADSAAVAKNGKKVTATAAAKKI